MAEELHKAPRADLLPVRQRLAWMAAIWVLSVGAMALLSWLIKVWIA